MVALLYNMLKAKVATEVTLEAICDFFPQVTVVDQNFSSTCPPNASFEFFSGHVIPWAFSERCVLEVSAFT